VYLYDVPVLICIRDTKTSTATSRSNSSGTSALQLSAATFNDVIPRLFTTIAPLHFTSSFSTSVCPASAANCNAVAPQFVLPWASAYCSKRYVTMLVCPLYATIFRQVPYNLAMVMMSLDLGPHSPFSKMAVTSTILRQQHPLGKAEK
jgi:hypothetical protein